MTSLLLMRPETGPESINDFMVRSTQVKMPSRYKINTLVPKGLGGLLIYY
jgi:hypothetical protein